MVTTDEMFKTRINGSLLAQFKGQLVCVMGEVATPDAAGMSFKIKTSDDIQVIIQLQEPLQEPIEGIVEVHGVVKNEKLISCRSFVQFPSTYTKNFDMKMYNDAVKIINKNPQLYSHSAENPM